MEKITHKRSKKYINSNDREFKMILHHVSRVWLTKNDLENRNKRCHIKPWINQNIITSQ